MTILTNLRVWLDHLYPGLWNASVAALAVLVLWLLKKFAPNFFAKLPPSIQALPAVFIAAIVSGVAALAPTLLSFLSSAAAGGLLGGVTAVGVHHVLKESKLPYGTDPKDPNSVVKTAASAGLLLFALGIIPLACAGIQQGTSDVCTFIDSKNPLIGAVCATVEEVESFIQHVLATRALRAAHPEAAKVDICAAPLPSSSGAAP